MMLRSIPEASPDVSKLAEYLRTVAEGDVVRYEDLSGVINRDVLSARYLLQSARRQLLSEGLVFGAVRSIGLRRLPVDERAAVGSDVKPIRRALHRKMRVLHTVDPSKLAQGVMSVYYTGVALVGGLMLLTKPSEVRRLTAYAEGAGRPLNLTETLKLFAQDKKS